METECTAGETNNRCRQAESKLRYSSYELRFPGIHVWKYHVRINANCLFFLGRNRNRLDNTSKAIWGGGDGRNRTSRSFTLDVGGGSGHYVETLECKPKWVSATQYMARYYEMEPRKKKPPFIFSAEARGKMRKRWALVTSRSPRVRHAPWGISFHLLSEGEKGNVGKRAPLYFCWNSPELPEWYFASYFFGSAKKTLWKLAKGKPYRRSLLTRK